MYRENHIISTTFFSKIRKKTININFKGRFKFGFSFLEILLTISIMSIALVPIMRIMPEGMVAGTRLDRSTKSIILAQGKMEEVRSQVLSTSATYGFDKDYNEPGTAFPSPDQRFKYTVSDNLGADVKELSVVVWFDINDDDLLHGYERSIDIHLKIANRG